MRGSGWTTQISPSPHCQQEGALWGDDKHPLDFRFENGKCTAYFWESGDGEQNTAEGMSGASVPFILPDGVLY